MHLLQKMFMEKHLCWFAYKEPYVLYKTMLERMTESIFSSSNVHEVVDDNNNSYKSRCDMNESRLCK
jgi:NAD(P)H-flavin reductase